MKQKGIHFFIHKYILLLASLLCILMMGGCGNEDSVSRDFEEDEVFRIGSMSCRETEINIYVVNMENQYKEAYGTEIWSLIQNSSFDNASDATAVSTDAAVSDNGAFGSSSVSDNDSFEAEIRNTVLTRLAKIKMLNLLAQANEITLEQSELDLCTQAAKQYYNMLSKEEREALGGVKLSTIETMYQEYALADKVYHYYTDSVTPEISDEQARTVTVKQIFMSNSNLGNLQQESTILDQLRNGENFDTLAATYNEKAEDTISVQRGDLEETLENAIFNLAQNEVSNVITGSDGYYIFYCVSPYDEEETQKRKEELVTESKNAAFNEAYSTFAATQSCYLNRDLWNAMVIPEGENITTSGFFDVYNTYFAQQ